VLPSSKSAEHQLENLNNQVTVAMKKQVTRTSRNVSPSALTGPKALRAAAILIMSICGACADPSYTRLPITRELPDAAQIDSLAGPGGATVEPTPVPSGSGGVLGALDITSAGDPDASVGPGESGHGGSEAAAASGGSPGQASGGADAPAYGGSGPGGQWSGGGMGSPPLGDGTGATGGVPGQAAGGAGGAGGKRAGGASGASAGGAGGAGGVSASADTARYNFETSSQSWGIAVGTDPFISMVRSTVQHFAGAASLAGTLSAVAGKNYFLEVAPPVPAIPASATITLHVFVPAVAQLSAVRSYVFNDAFVLAYVDTPASALKRDAWTTVTLSVPATETNVIRLGVKLMSTGAWTGTVYVDSIDW
jgi:hypothetical protein